MFTAHYVILDLSLHSLPEMQKTGSAYKNSMEKEFYCLMIRGRSNEQESEDMVSKRG